MFVQYAGIVHVQCYRGWYVETGYVNTILGKVHKIKYAILTRNNTYLGHTVFARSFLSIESLFGGKRANSSYVRDKCPCQFSQGRELGVSMYGEWREKHAHADIFVAHCGFQSQYWDKFKHLDRSLENVLKVVSVLCVARTPSKGTTNGGN